MATNLGKEPAAAVAGDAPKPGVIEGVYIGGPQLRAYTREYLTLSATKWVGSIAALFWMYFYGSGWIEWTGFLLFHTLNMIGMSVGYHRLFTHRSFKTVKPVEYMLGMLCHLASQGPIVKWAADHRRHHANSDRPGDTHSPFFDSYGKPMTGWRAFYNSHFGWILDDTYSDVNHFAKGLVDDPVVQFCDRTRFVWFWLSLTVMPALWAVMLGGGWTEIIGTMLIAGFLRSLFGLHVILALNSVCHKHGYQNFAGPQNAQNNWILAIVTMGEGWHNNHHRHANVAYLRYRWYEIDLTGSFILLLEKLGLAWDVQRAPKYRSDENGQLVPMARKQD